MSIYKKIEIIQLSREEYLTSVKKIDDFNSLKFAKHSLDWWDEFYSWSKFPPLCLVDEKKHHICYLFYNVSKDNEYLTIHNILTPKKYRENGYAYEILKSLFSELSNGEIKRFKLFCVSSSIEFYNRLGLKYWGVNDLGQYYCDFKMPKLDINEIKNIVNSTTLDEFSTIKLNEIYDKLKLNGSSFDEKNREIYDDCMKRMDGRYMFDRLKYEVDHREEIVK